jgi:uncharacterized protein YidB (DUF937 family)
MGLLDSVIGALGQNQGGGAAMGGGGDLLGAVIGMLGQGGGQGGGLGGLAGLVAKMQQSGLGDVAASWVGTGQNLPIDADQLGGVLGRDNIDGMAQQLGVNSGDLMGQLTQMLPQLVDKLTPQGQIPQGDIGGMLGGLLGGQGGGAQAGGGLGDLAGMLGGLLNKR